MSGLQTTEPHLRIAHSIAERIMSSNFTEHEIKILFFILRLSWGCGRHSAYIPKQRDFEIIGVPECRIKSRLAHLVRAQVIFRDGVYYQLNNNFDEWEVSHSREYTQEKLYKLISLNLKGHDRNLRELYNLTSSEKEELYKMSSQNFTNCEVRALQNVKFLTPDSASPKEILNKNKDDGGMVYIYNNTPSSSSSAPSADAAPAEKTVTIAEVSVFYTENIGPINRPYIAETLKDFCCTYTPRRTLEAFREAVLSGAKSPLTYVQRILENRASGIVRQPERMPFSPRKYNRYNPDAGREAPDYVMRGCINAHSQIR